MCRAARASSLLLLFQPNGELTGGARAVVADGLYAVAHHAVPHPDVLLGAHIMPTRVGAIATRRGVFDSAADSTACQVNPFLQGNSYLPGWVAPS